MAATLLLAIAAVAALVVLRQHRSFARGKTVRFHACTLADRVPECLRIVLEADEAIKTGRSPRSDDALYWAVLELGRVGARVPLVAQ